MATDFTDLPHELLLLIVELLDSKDALRLSAASRRLHETLLPTVYKQISFTSDVASAKSALLAALKYGQYTREISFVGTSGRDVARNVGTLTKGLVQYVNHESEYEGCEDDYGADERPVNINRERHLPSCTDPVTCPLNREDKWYITRCLPRAAEELLKGASLPNLRTLRLMVYFESEDHAGELLPHQVPSVRFSLSQHSEEKLAKEEGTARWRAFNAAVWRAVSANRRISELVLREWLPLRCTAFSSQQFQQLLGRLEAFDISFWNKTGRNDLSPSFYRMYRFGVRCLQSGFFQHMERLKRLRIETSAYFSLGIGGSKRVGLPIARDHLPRLETLELQGCFVGADLVDFIREHSHVLRKLSLVDCFCLIENPARAGYYFQWDFFFWKILAIAPALVELNVTPFDPLRLTCRTDPQVIAEVLRILDSDPRQRMFGYATGGHVFCGARSLEEGQIVQRFLEGDDLKAYEELLDFVKVNARSA